MKQMVLLIFTINVSVSLGQTYFKGTQIEESTLNLFIQKELNEFRKKAKVEAVTTESALTFAAEDHAAYMLKKQKLTHKQNKRIKKTPKNRVDYYGQQFNLVGENVQLTNLNLNSTIDNKKAPLLNSYEKLAENLVLAWRNSPPHYRNMINPNFKTTYTSIAVGENGEVYACQLFGGSKYQDIYVESRDSVKYKPDRNWRCWRCRIRPPAGKIEVLQDSTIVFNYQAKRICWGLLPAPSIFYSRMRFFNPWRDGLAADIIVKSQYPCDTNSYHNGISNVRGIPLEPIYKKNYMGIPFNKTQIVLGKVPSYIHEDFEVNLIVIQNKRPCSNSMFYVIPAKFDLEIPLDFGFTPSDALMKLSQIDTISERLFFDKSKITSNDSILSDVIEKLKNKKNQIRKIEVIGFASLEGSSENNTLLYQNRAQFILQKLIEIGIDSTIVTLITSENFKDFRRDIIGTKHEYLGGLNDSELKEKLMDKELSAELEYILKNHRYVNLQVITRNDYEEKYNSKKVNSQLRRSILKGNKNESTELQRVQYGLYLSGDMSIEEIKSVEIPIDKKNLKLLHNLAIMEFEADSKTVKSLQALRASLWNLRSLKEEDQDINTSLAIIDYYLFDLGYYHSKKVTFFDSIRKWKNLDRVQQARILLNVASKSDWSFWNANHSYNQSKYYFQKTKQYIKPAKLDVDETFEVATYYTFFWQYRYALNLTKGKIDETKNPADLIFFLKLIHLTDTKINRNQYLNYFKKIRTYSGDAFCSFFNNPALNFQILDDEEIKEIYCKTCQTP